MNCDNMAEIADSRLALIEIFCLFLGLSGCIIVKLDHKEPNPYMDEVFHIPQVQKYCNGLIHEWDPMITTLPGLYITTVGIYKPLSWLLDVPMKELCSTFWLRIINVGYAVGNFVLLLLLVDKLHNGDKNYTGYKQLVVATTLGMFPVLYFFTFLYYTDAGSTFYVLLSYLLCLRGKHGSAALSGTVAVLFRQTNIMWVVFVAGLVAIQEINTFVKTRHKVSDAQCQDWKYISTVFQELCKFSGKDIHEAAALVLRILASTWKYMIVILLFAAFVFINGGIVVGAKDDHQVTTHFPQLFYFAAFSALFSSMHVVTFSNVENFIKTLYKRPFVSIIASLVAAGLVWKFTIAHRYLLADNRHYTFYVWSKIFRRHDSIKYLLIPGYLYAVWCINRAISATDVLWRLSFILCLVMTLVPSPLLEFRYFIIPYLIYRLNMPLSSYWKLSMELLLYFAVNIVTVYLFLEKPFQWEGHPGQQRFMW